MNRQNINDGALSPEMWSSERIKELTLSKIYEKTQNTDECKHVASRYGRRFASVAVIVVLTLSLATAALAATGVINLGAGYSSLFSKPAASPDSMSEDAIVVRGDGAIDFGDRYNSIFNNPDVAPYIKTDDAVTVKGDGGITIEPLTGFVDANRGGVYVQLKIHDPTGVMTSDSLDFVQEDDQRLNAGDVSLNIIDENTVIASMFTQAFEIIDGKVKLNFHTIVSGIKLIEDTQQTGFNLGEHIGMTEPVLVPGAEFIEITGVESGNGKLTISRRHSDASLYGWDWATIGAQTPDGEVIWFSHGVSYYGTQGSSYDYEIGALDPNDLTLVWHGWRAENAVTGNWELTVAVDNTLKPRTVEGTYDNHYAQAVFGGTSVRISVFEDLFYREMFEYTGAGKEAVAVGGTLRILLTDGTVILPTLGGWSKDKKMAKFNYDTEFINPDDVVSVTFFGETLDGTFGTLTEEEVNEAREQLYMFGSQDALGVFADENSSNDN